LKAQKFYVQSQKEKGTNRRCQNHILASSNLKARSILETHFLYFEGARLDVRAEVEWGRVFSILSYRC
jgi:hypothetical protein